MEVYMTFQEFVQKEMKVRNITRKQLAMGAGCKYSLISAFVTGLQKSIDLEVASKIIQFFGGSLPVGVEPPIDPSLHTRGPNRDRKAWIRLQHRVQIIYPQAPTEYSSMISSSDSRAKFPVWKTVEIGNCVSGDELFTKLDESDAVVMPSDVDCVIPEIKVNAHKLNIDLVIATPEMLGFSLDWPPRNFDDRSQLATLTNICKRGAMFGLGVCPPEIAGQLLRQYDALAEDEVLDIAMEPILFDGEEKRFKLKFLLSLYNRLGLVQAHSTNEYHQPQSRWIFVDLRGMAPSQIRELYQER